MKIVRSSAEANFTQIPNDALRDRRLSWKARGLLGYLLSHVDGWSVDADRLAHQGPDGRHAILAGLKELEQAGYITRRKRRAERGQWVTDMELRDTPNQTNDASPTSDFPTSENRTPDRPTEEVKPQVAPEAGFPTSGNPTAGQPNVGEPAADLEHHRGDQQENQEENQGDPGGAPPPDPWRPPAPRSSAPGIESENSLLSSPGQPPRPETATHDRAREDDPALRLIAATEDPEPAAENSTLFPAAVPPLAPVPVGPSVIRPAQPRSPFRRPDAAAEAIAQAQANRAARIAAHKAALAAGEATS